MQLLTDDVMGELLLACFRINILSWLTTGELLDEIRLIGIRLGIEGAATVPLNIFLKANPDTEYGKAVRQYCSRPRRNLRKSHSGPTGANLMR